MGFGLLIGVAILLILSVFDIFLFIRSIKRKSKIGLIISILIGLIVAMCLLTNKIDEITLTKKDVKKDLSFIKLELKDNFEILDNKVSGMPERIQETKLEISNSDRNRIIDEIEHAKNFKLFSNDDEAQNDTAFDYTFSNKISNFKCPDYYFRTTYRQVDNIPTRISVSVNDTSNILEYSMYAK
jgi:uncharacterized membrane-anchored protein YhcB (DUF1043 family)